MRGSLLYRSALLSWVAVILVLGLFLLLILPMQRDMLRLRLASTAEVIATSIHQVTVSTIVVEDYSPVIEHCLKVVQERPMVLFIVITRQDGFSLLHTAEGWRYDPDGLSWGAGGTASWTFEHSDLAEDEVFRFVQPLRYSGIDWGWIHIGLSLDQYRQDLKSTFVRLGGIGVACLIVASLISLLFARRLSRPIQHLAQVTSQVATGDLGARAAIEGSDDVASLATAFNRMADTLQRAHTDLERRVQERTAELSASNQELIAEIQERQAAEAARNKAESELATQQALTVRSDRLRSLGEMAAGIAHELNQPLTGVRGLSELGILDYDSGMVPDAAAGRQMLHEIMEQADRMARIIEHVRMFAREAGRPETTVVDINEVVEAALDLLGAQMRSRGVSLRVDLERGLPLVDVNRYSLEEVVLNLITNARDALEGHDSTEEVPTIVVRTRLLDDHRGETLVGLEVVDEGVGIDPEALSRVFEPFYTTKEPDRGTGLGRIQA
jgi:signal transduction histidine kinase